MRRNVNTDRRTEPDVVESRWRPSRADVWTYLLTFGPGVLLLAAVALQTRVPIPVLMKDPLAVVPLTKTCCHFYYGLVSNLGVMLWSAGAAICLFACVLLLVLSRRGPDVVFLGAAGVFTGWLGLDDLFMIHEDVLPFFGVPQFVTYAAYAAAVALYFAVFWRQIFAHRPMLMALALLLLGASVVIDVVWHTDRAARVFIEDGAKFLGILAWNGFHVTAALKLGATATRQPRAISV